MTYRRQPNGIIAIAGPQWWQMDEVRPLEFETKAHDVGVSSGHREALSLAGL